MRRVRPVMANGRLSRTYAARSISWFPSTTQIWCTKCGTTPKILKFLSGNFAGFRSLSPPFLAASCSLIPEINSLFARFGNLLSK